MNQENDCTIPWSVSLCLTLSSKMNSYYSRSFTPPLLELRIWMIPAKDTPRLKLNFGTRHSIFNNRWLRTWSFQICVYLYDQREPFVVIRPNKNILTNVESLISFVIGHVGQSRPGAESESRYPTNVDMMWVFLEIGFWESALKLVLHNVKLFSKIGLLGHFRHFTFFIGAERRIMGCRKKHPKKYIFSPILGKHGFLMPEWH